MHLKTKPCDIRVQIVLKELNYSSVGVICHLQVTYPTRLCAV